MANAEPMRPADAGPTDSLWPSPSRARHPAPDGDMEVDVAVVGAGIVGLTAAVLVARAGRTVAVLERRRIGEGTTGRSTAKVSALQGVKYQQIRRLHGDEAARRHARAQTEALEWMDQQVRTGAIECDWERRTAVTYATSERGAGVVHDEVAAASAAGLEVTTQRPTDLPFPTTAAVFLEGQAQFSPRAYLEGLARELDLNPAATVHEDSPVTAIRGRGPHHVITPHGTIRARHVVVATLLPVTDRALLFARTRPVVSYAVACRLDGDPPPHQYLSVEDPTRSLRTARPAGEPVLVVGGQGSGLARGPSPRRAAQELVEWARRTFPVAEVTAAWSAHDLASPDHLPWVGPTSPLTPRVLTATGFGKWGMTMGTAAAHLLADHIVGDRSGDDDREEGPWSIYHPARLAPRSWPSAARMNLEVASRLARDWARPDEAADRRGEGRRFRAGLVPRGDPDGDPGTPPVRVVCTHLGGVCRWNDLERTWDCPLHGSRFEADGTVISGPAVRPLDRPG